MRFVTRHVREGFGARFLFPWTFLSSCAIELLIEDRTIELLLKSSDDYPPCFVA